MSNPHQAPEATNVFNGQRATWVRWLIVALLMGMAFLNHFNRTCMPVVDLKLMDEFGFNLRQMSWIYSSFLLAYVLCMIPGGWVADWQGGWRALAISGVGTGVFVAMTGLGGWEMTGMAALASFAAIRFAMGIFTAPLFPAAGRIVAAWIPFGSRAWANGLVLGATTIGVSLSHVWFGKLSDAVGWRAAFACTGAITALLALGWMAYGRNRPADHAGVNAAERALAPDPSSDSHANPSQRNPPGHWNASRIANLLLLTCNYAAVGYYEYTLFYWMEYYFKQVREYSVSDSRDYASIVPLAMVVAMPLGGWLSDRLVLAWGYRAGRAVVPVVGMMASAVLLFAATHAVDRVWVVLLFLLAHGAIGLCEAPTWVAALEIGGRRSGLSASIVNAGGNLGGLLAPIVTAHIATQFDWHWGLGAASITSLVGVLLWAFIRLERPRGD